MTDEVQQQWQGVLNSQGYLDGFSNQPKKTDKDIYLKAYEKGKEDRRLSDLSA